MTFSQAGAEGDLHGQMLLVDAGQVRGDWMGRQAFFSLPSWAGEAGGSTRARTRVLISMPLISKRAWEAAPRLGFRAR